MVSGARRIAVTGLYGSGKTRLGQDIAGRLAIPFIDYDDAQWNSPSVLSDAIHGTDPWVIAGGERETEDSIWARADMVVWIDPPIPVVLTRVLRRSLFDADKPGLWNGRTRSRRNLLNARLVVRSMPRLASRRRSLAQRLTSNPVAIRLSPWEVARFLRSLQ